MSSMNNKNCPNCGAPYDADEHKCPYCGTIYFDMSIIDFDHQEPFYLKIKKDGLYYTQLVRPTVAAMTVTYDTVAATSNNNTLYQFTTNKSSSIDISFEALVDKDVLTRVQKK